ncbi:MAG: hypothetical protein AVDCRST_MAG73-3039, partial [uncultured Thermomicrobiales bacterium]
GGVPRQPGQGVAHRAAVVVPLGGAGRGHLVHPAAGGDGRQICRRPAGRRDGARADPRRPVPGLRGAGDLRARGPRLDPRPNPARRGRRGDPVRRFLGRAALPAGPGARRSSTRVGL